MKRTPDSPPLTPEIKTSSPKQETEQAEEKQLVSEIITSKGSIYRYLEDGRTQRYKSTGEVLDPQDTLTFIPPWDQIKDQAGKLYPDIFKGIDSQAQFEQLLLEYAQQSGRTIRVIDEKNKELLTSEDVNTATRVFLALVDRDDPERNFTLPVSVKPKLGYLTFDTRVTTDEEGNRVRERHIGNKIVEIKYRK